MIPKERGAGELLAIIRSASAAERRYSVARNIVIGVPGPTLPWVAGLARPDALRPIKYGSPSAKATSQ